MRNFNMSGTVSKTESKQYNGKSYTVVTLNTTNGKKESAFEVIFGGESAAAAAKLTAGTNISAAGYIQAGKNAEGKTRYSLYATSANVFASAADAPFPAPFGATCILTGRLTATPVPENSRCRIAVAQNSKNGEAMFFNMTAFSREAETLTAITDKGPRFSKGDTVIVEGRMSCTEQYGVEFVVSNIGWLAASRANTANADAPVDPAAPAASVAHAAPASNGWEDIPIADDLPF